MKCKQVINVKRFLSIMVLFAGWSFLTLSAEAVPKRLGRLRRRSGETRLQHDSDLAYAGNDAPAINTQ